jgi:hypothetical protein
VKRFLLAVFAISFLISGNLDAQSPVPATGSSKFTWTISSPTLADAQAYTYRVYADGSVTGIVLSGVTCTGAASPFVCEAPIPAFTPGNHTATLTASNIAGESAKSDPLGFNFVVTPSKPGNFGLK